MRSRVLQFALAALLTVIAASGAQAQPGFAVVEHIAVVPSSKGLSVQITASRAVKPQLTRLDNPVRIVIDLPGASLPGGLRRIPVRSGDISEVRASEWKASPPVARIVVQLRVAREYSVISKGNKVSVWLLPGTEQATATREPSGGETPGATETPGRAVPAATFTPTAELEPVANFETLHGAQSVSAMGNPTVLRLPRGGQIHVCPGTTLSVTPSKSGHDLMLGLGTGTIETHYRLGSASDVILTPDFRILLPGPGEFDLAISADLHGNTCVRALPGNTAAAVISEIMGNDTYQVNSDDHVLFHNGRLQNASSTSNLDCGCPLRTVPVMRTEAQPPAESASAKLPPATRDPPPARRIADVDPAPAVPSGAAVEVEAPFVFRANRPKGPDTVEVAELHFANGPRPELLSTDVSGPTRISTYNPKPGKLSHRSQPPGFLTRVGRFIGRMFR
ncbi:MAG TPA: AMIN domain-containing protein [Terriglobales bacterium]|nr:AMIN domain-containing protein [Terriglobales bacterium]